MPHGATTTTNYATGSFMPTIRWLHYGMRCGAAALAFCLATRLRVYRYSGHRLSLACATRIETFDGRDVYGEDRSKTVGLVEPALLAVVYTTRGKDGEPFD